MAAKAHLLISDTVDAYVFRLGFRKQFRCGRSLKTDACSVLQTPVASSKSYYTDLHPDCPRLTDIAVARSPSASYLKRKFIKYIVKTVPQKQVPYAKGLGIWLSHVGIK